MACIIEIVIDSILHNQNIYTDIVSIIKLYILLLSLLLVLLIYEQCTDW